MGRDVFGIVGTTQAGAFKVESVVAEGGFGVVYKAYHSSFRAAVALKCLKVPESMSEEHREEFLEKFRSEGELLFRLSQMIPAVVRPLHVDVLELDHRLVPFLALEWLEGETLDHVVAQRRDEGRKPMAAHKCVKLLAPIAQALARAHRFPGPDGPMCVIHRDLKPENIFLARIGGAEVPKILDFGIARAKSAAAHEAGRVTAGERMTAFTPGYAAPEQWLPKRFGQAGPWTDVYGLAMTLSEVLTGKSPVEGEIGEMMAAAIDEQRRPTPRTDGATLPDEAEAAFARALAVDPRERAQSIEEFWTPLERALGLRPSLVAVDARREPSAPPPPLETPGTSETTARSDRGPEPMATIRGGGPGPSAPALAALAARADNPTLPAAPAAPEEAPPHAAIPDLLAPAPSPASRKPPGSRPRAPPMVAPTSPFDDDEPLNAPLATVRAPERPKPRPPPSQVAAAYVRPGAHGSEASLGDRLRPALRWIYLAIAITVADQVYTRMTNEVLSLAGYRPVWIAGPLAALGVAMALWRVLSAHTE